MGVAFWEVEVTVDNDAPKTVILTDEKARKLALKGAGLIPEGTATLKLRMRGLDEAKTPITVWSEPYTFEKKAQPTIVNVTPGKGVVDFSTTGMTPSCSILVVIQKYFSTGKPDGDSYSQTLTEKYADTRMRSNDYSLGLDAGQYGFTATEESERGSTGLPTAEVKVTVK